MFHQALSAWAEPALYLPLSGIVGLVIGSFLNVVIHRLPLMMEREWRTQCLELLQQGRDDGEGMRFNLLRPGSHCPSCGTAIPPWRNIPLVSYLLLKGRCGHCAAPISPRYPIVEALCGLLSLVVAWQLGPTWQTVAALCVTWALIAASLIDLEHQLLPDSITLPLLWLGLLVNLAEIFTDLRSAVLGAVTGYLTLWLIFHAFKAATGKEGMGFGDFKLLAMLGAWVGWAYIPQIVILSSLAGAIVGIGLILFAGREKAQPIPFGPYLAIAGWVALLWGEQINRFYLDWTGLPP